MSFSLENQLRDWSVFTVMPVEIILQTLISRRSSTKCLGGWGEAGGPGKLGINMPLEAVTSCSDSSFTLSYSFVWVKCWNSGEEKRELQRLHISKVGEMSSPHGCLFYCFISSWQNKDIFSTLLLLRDVCRCCSLTTCSTSIRPQWIHFLLRWSIEDMVFCFCRKGTQCHTRILFLRW